MVVSIHWTGQLDWTSGGVGGPAGPALAGPLFSGLLVSFPDCISTHVLLYTQSCVYVVQLLEIWRIPLLAVVLLLSLALHVGLLRRLPTSPSFPFPKQLFGKKNIVYRSFQPSWFASLHIACCRPPSRAHLFAVAWPPVAVSELPGYPGMVGDTRGACGKLMGGEKSGPSP